MARQQVLQSLAHFDPDATGRVDRSILESLAEKILGEDAPGIAPLLDSIATQICDYRAFVELIWTLDVAHSCPAFPKQPMGPSDGQLAGTQQPAELASSLQDDASTSKVRAEVAKLLSGLKLEDAIADNLPPTALARTSEEDLLSSFNALSDEDVDDIMQRAVGCISDRIKTALSTARSALDPIQVGLSQGPAKEREEAKAAAPVSPSPAQAAPLEAAKVEATAAMEEVKEAPAKLSPAEPEEVPQTEPRGAPKSGIAEDAEAVAAEEREAEFKSMNDNPAPPPKSPNAAEDSMQDALGKTELVVSAWAKFDIPAEVVSGPSIQEAEAERLLLMLKEKLWGELSKKFQIVEVIEG